MLFSEKCIYAAQKTYPLLRNSLRISEFKPGNVPQRTFFFNSKRKELPLNNESEENKLKRLSGIDDENFTYNLKLILRNPKLYKQSFINFLGEFKKLSDEYCEYVSRAWNPRVDSREGRVDMIYTFETKNDINKFTVCTDSSFNIGYSSASLKLTGEGTAVFSGNISKKVPKDGNVKVTGFATIITHRLRKAFLRPKNSDWTEYTDLVLKIRGDGRTYMIVINIDTPYVETKYFQYGQYLYTRGGPYWQIAKIPLAHFIAMQKGNLLVRQAERVQLNKISRFGITAAAYEGPFKLEIDYIGLEHDVRYKAISPFEEYS